MPLFSIPEFGIGWIIAIIVIISVSVIIEIIRNRDLDIDNIEETIQDCVVLRILVPKQDLSSYDQAQQLFSSMHSIVGKKRHSYVHLSCEYYATPFGIQWYIVCPRQYKNYIEGQWYAHYPSAEINVVDDYAQGLHMGGEMQMTIKAAEIELEKESLFPIKTGEQFHVDLLSSITSSLGGMEQFDSMGIQFVIRPLHDSWHKAGKEYLTAWQKGTKIKSGWKAGLSIFTVTTRIYEWIFGVRHWKVKSNVMLDKTQEEEIHSIEEKFHQHGYAGTIRIVSSSQDVKRAEEHLLNVIHALKQVDSFHLNSLKVLQDNDKYTAQMLDHYKTRFLDVEAQDIFSCAEIATLYHLPHANITTPEIIWLKARRSDPPLNLPTDNMLTIAQTNYRGGGKQFGILKEDRRKHMYLLGKTGSGKTTMLCNMILQDILAGNGVGVIDPHGDLIDEILEHIPSERVEDVVLLDPSDSAYPASLNIFAFDHPSQREYIAASILAVFKKHFDSWGPRLEYILHNVILSLLYTPDATLLGISRMLTDKGYRQYVVSNITDPILQKFWNEEYAYMERNPRLVTEAITPIQNKVGRFVSSPMLRNIIGQTHNKIDFDEIMNKKKIFLCNVSQGKIGEENASLLGSLVITKMQMAAMARVSILESQREDFYLYIDEFQVFATDVFTKILSEARKYRLDLILAHQHLSQLEEHVKDAIMGNIGTLITFVLGSPDAQVLEREFLPILSANDLMSLDRYEVYVKLMIQGVVSKPFSAASIQMPFAATHIRDEILRYSRTMYASPEADVNEWIKEWSMKAYQFKHEEIKNVSAPLFEEERSHHEERRTQILPNQPLRFD